MTIKFKIPNVLLFFIVCLTLLINSITYGETTSIVLSSGWNFISFPKLPTSATVATVFRDVSPNVRVVWGYDNVNKAWLKCSFKTQNSTLNTLDKVESGKGYWVYMNAPGSIGLSSWATQSTTVSLAEGWNLTGHNGANNALFTDALSSISDKWTIIWGWDNGTWGAQHVSGRQLPVPGLPGMPNGLLYRGKAYWIQTIGAAEWSQSQQPTTTNLEAQLTTRANWHLIKTYDKQPENKTLMSTPSGKKIMAGDGGLDDITTYTAKGLVSDYLGHLYADDVYIVAGTLTDGFSYIRTSDVNNPRSKVFNYRGRDTSDATGRFGLQGFTKRNSDGKIYAWYGFDIVDVINKQIVYSSAPDFTHSTFGCTPKDRFLTDESGSFWIGAVNLDESSNNRGENGLYKISADFSGKMTILSDAIWNLFKDSGGTIWIVSNKGIYKRDEGGSPALVYDSQSRSPARWAEQVIEHNGEIYAVMKNFFHYPHDTPTKLFELYRWNGTTFIKVCDVHSGSNDSAQAFVYSGSLYIKMCGDSGRTYLFNAGSAGVSLGNDIGSNMGHYRLTAVGNALVSVGNVSGISIYNWGENGQTMRITAANTAEALIADNIHSLYVSQATNRLLIGPEHAEGFNVFVNNAFEIYEFPNTEVNTVGFFERKGKPYIQGAGNLYYLDAGQVVQVKDFSTNGEKIYYDRRDYVWAFPNWGSGYGGIGLLNLENLAIRGTKGHTGNDYWQTEETWTFDQGYHFYDVISLPGEEAVFIAVGDSEDANPYKKMPFVLKYSYKTNTFEKMALPDTNLEGICAFATDSEVVYGAARQKLFVYKNGTWQYFCPLKLGNDFRGMKVFGKYLFIVSGWNSNGSGLKGGLEVVDLEARVSSHFTTAQIPLPTDAIFSIAVQDFGNERGRLWLGTFSGLAYCDLYLPDLDIIPPPVPSDLTINNGCTDGTAALQWTPSQATDLLGYKIYYGRTAGNYDQSIIVTDSTHTFTNFDLGKWYFAVTAVDTASPQNESGFSNEAMVTCLDSIAPPVPPLDLTINNGCTDGTAALQWTPSQATDLLGYKIYYGRTAGNYDQSIIVTDSTHTFTNFDLGKWYFAVTAVDTASPQNEIGFSNEVSCTVQ